MSYDVPLSPLHFLPNWAVKTPIQNHYLQIFSGFPEIDLLSFSFDHLWLVWLIVNNHPADLIAISIRLL